MESKSETSTRKRVDHAPKGVFDQLNHAMTSFQRDLQRAVNQSSPFMKKLWKVLKMVSFLAAESLLVTLLLRSAGDEWLGRTQNRRFVEALALEARLRIARGA